MSQIIRFQENIVPAFVLLVSINDMKGYQVTFVFLELISFFILALAASPGRAISQSKYTVAHSLGDDYSFDPRDGWQAVNVTNLDYKYQFRKEHSPQRRGKGKSALGDAIGGVVKNIWKGLKGIGSKEPVTITWYARLCWTWIMSIDR